MHAGLGEKGLQTYSRPLYHHVSLYALAAWYGQLSYWDVYWSFQSIISQAHGGSNTTNQITVK